MLDLKSKINGNNLNPKSIIDGLKQELFFKNKCLKEETRSAQEYLNEIKFNINLQDFYRMKDSTYNYDDLEHTGILLEIVHPEIKQKYNNANYLLQVWKDDSKNYEKTLNYECKLWASSYDYFMYLPKHGDEGSDCLHIFKQDEPKKIAKIRNFGQEDDVKFVCYNSEAGQLCVASSKWIKIISLTKEQIEESDDSEYHPAQRGTDLDKSLDAEQMHIRTINPGSTIHYLIYAYEDGQFFFAFETPDNQLEFNKLIVENMEDDSTFTYKFKQYTEVQPRKDSTCDPIVKCIVKYNDFYPFAITMRQSGHFDIYWDCQRRDSSSRKVLDVDMSCSSFYLKVREQVPTQQESTGFLGLGGSKQETITVENIYVIAHNGDSSITCDMMEKVPDGELEFNQVCLKGTQESVKLFGQLHVMKLECNSILIAHNRILSVYDIIEQKWVNHTYFTEGDIWDIFLLQQGGKTNFGVLLYGGQIYYLNKDQLQTEKVITPDKKKHQVEGIIVNTKQDDITFKTYMIISKSDEVYKCSVLVGENMQEVHDLQGFDDTSSFAYCQMFDSKDRYLIVQNQVTHINKTKPEGKQDEIQAEVKIYKFIYPKALEDEDDAQYDEEDYGGEWNDAEEAEENEEENKEGEGEGEHKEEEQHEEEHHEEEQHEEEHHEEEGGDYGEEDNGDKQKKSTGQVDQKGEDEEGEEDEAEFEGGEDEEGHDNNVAAKVDKSTVTFKLILDLGLQKDIIDTIHSAIIYDINESIVMCDPQNIYVVNLKDKKCQVYKDQNCFSFLQVEKDYIYSLGQEVPELNLKEGLRIYNLTDLVKSNRCKSILLTEFDVGASANISYIDRVGRMFYIRSLTDIEIIPPLHQCMIKFIGIESMKNYLAYKIIKDKFITLNKKGYLQTWNIINGKLVKVFKLKGDWFSKYEAQSSKDDAKAITLEQRALLKSIEPVEGAKYQDHYEAWQQTTQMANQETYLQNCEQAVYDFKYIEIKNETEIKEHFSFQDAYQSDQNELYINDKMDRLIKVLRFGKTYLYNIVTQGNGKTKLQMIQRLNNYPDELEIPDDALQCFSPDFSQTLQMDRKQKCFIIRDTITNQDLCLIPTEIMTFKNMDDAKNLIRRFKWVDNTCIKIVNLEGMEKIINYMDDFKELAYNKVPEFQLFKDDWLEGTFYYYKKQLAATDSVKLLKRKYQTYKSIYYLDGVRDETKFYQELFSVDPRDVQYTQLSFTFLDWRLIEQICDGSIDIPDLNIGQVEKMFYNILPGGDTVLHKLCDKEQTDDLIEIFKMSQPNVSKLTDIKFHIPFLPNFKNETAMHIAVRKQDFKTINLFIKYLAGYELDHHSRSIKDLYPVFIENEIAEFLPYLDSRMQSTRQTRVIQKGAIKENHNGITSSALWFRKSDIESEVFNKESKSESRLKAEFVDLPGVYHYEDADFDGFFGALAGTSWYDVFTKKAIKNVINYNYRLVKEYTIKKLFIPFCFFLLFYIFYFNYVNELYQEVRATATPDEQYKVWLLYVLNLVCVSMLGLFAAYFFKNEVKQLIQDPLGYFTSFWNYIDIIPVAGIAAIILMQLYPGTPVDIQVIVRSITTFIMWMKLLYFLRIFKGTGYFIGMIFEVMIDIKYFLLVLCISIIAFGDSFLAISSANAEADRFVTSMVGTFVYTYLAILGDFSTDAFGTVATTLVWIFFLLCTFFNMIVMLNLLISIVSEAFAKVNSNAENAFYKEMASLIAENGYLIPEDIKCNYASKDQYLLAIQSLDSQDKEFSDPVQEQFENVKNMIDSIKKQNEKQDDTIAKMFQMIKKIKDKEFPDEIEEEQQQAEGEGEGENEDAEY